LPVFFRSFLIGLPRSTPPSLCHFASLFFLSRCCRNALLVLRVPGAASPRVPLTQQRILGPVSHRDPGLLPRFLSANLFHLNTGSPMGVVFPVPSLLAWKTVPKVLHGIESSHVRPPPTPDRLLELDSSFSPRSFISIGGRRCRLSMVPFCNRLPWSPGFKLEFFFGTF